MFCCLTSSNFILTGWLSSEIKETYSFLNSQKNSRNSTILLFFLNSEEDYSTMSDNGSIKENVAGNSSEDVDEERKKERL